MKPRGIKTSTFGTGYKKAKNKNPLSPEERKRQAKSLVSYRPDGGDAS
jgi:hypothetical protein